MHTVPDIEKEVKNLKALILYCLLVRGNANVPIYHFFIPYLSLFEYFLEV